MPSILVRPRPVDLVEDGLHIYVDAATGNDANNGSALAPLATLIEAERRVPLVVNQPIFVHVYMHPGLGYDKPSFHGRVCHENIYVVGEDYTVLLSGTMTSNTNLNQTVDVATGTDDVLRGKTLEILAGAMATERRTLRTNTGNTLIPLVGFTGNVPAGSAFRVTEPAVVIRCASDTWLLSEGCGAPGTGAQNLGYRQSAKGIVFVNVKIDTTTPSLNISFLGMLTLFGVELGGSAGNVWFAGTPGVSALHIGSDTSIQLDGIAARDGVELGAASDTSWAAWGLAHLSGILHFAGLNAYVLGANLARIVLWGCPRAQVFAFRITDGIRVWGGGESGACAVRFSAHCLFLGDSGASTVEAALDPVVQVAYGNAVLWVDCTVTSTVNGTGILATRGGAGVINGGTIDVGTGKAVRASVGGHVTITTPPTIIASTAYECGLSMPVTETAANMALSGAYLVHADGSACRRS